MKCNVILYNNKADKRVVDKTSYITTFKSLRGNFKDEVDLLNPTFTIESNIVPTCNYCYIEDFNRYYYINNVKVIRNNLYSISCSVDVLMSYKVFITNSTQYVSRQENTYNELLVDKYVSFSEDYEYQVLCSNIDELDYASNSKDNKTPTDKTNIVLCLYGKQNDIVE